MEERESHEEEKIEKEKTFPVWTTLLLQLGAETLTPPIRSNWRWKEVSLIREFPIIYDSKIIQMHMYVY